MIIKALIILMLMCSPVMATDWCQDGNIMGCWTMDVDESPIQDIATTNKDIVLKGSGEPDYTTGKYSGGYVFDGSNDYASVSMTPPNGAYTNVMWIKTPLDVGGNSRAISCFGNSVNQSSTYDRSLTINANTYKIAFMVYNSATYIATSTTSISGNTWTHIAGTVDTVNGNIIYFNGVAENTNSGGKNAYNGFTTPYFVLGSVWNSSYSQSTIDEVAVFNRTLSSTDISNIMDYGLQPATSSPVISVLGTGVYGNIIFN